MREVGTDQTDHHHPSRPAHLRRHLAPESSSHAAILSRRSEASLPPLPPNEPLVPIALPHASSTTPIALLHLRVVGACLPDFEHRPVDCRVEWT